MTGCRIWKLIWHLSRLSAGQLCFFVGKRSDTSGWYWVPKPLTLSGKCQMTKCLDDQLDQYKPYLIAAASSPSTCQVITSEPLLGMKSDQISWVVAIGRILIQLSIGDNKPPCFLHWVHPLCRSCFCGLLTSPPWKLVHKLNIAGNAAEAAENLCEAQWCLTKPERVISDPKWKPVSHCGICMRYHDICLVNRSS